MIKLQFGLAPKKFPFTLVKIENIYFSKRWRCWNYRILRISVFLIISCRI